MSEQWRDVVVKALAAYGAVLTAENKIARLGAVTSVRVAPMGKRLQFGTETHLLATTPQTENGVKQFVQKFWFWKPLPTPPAPPAPPVPPCS